MSIHSTCETRSYDHAPDMSAAVQVSWLQLQEARPAGGLTPSQHQCNRPDQRRFVQDQLQRFDITQQQQTYALCEGHHGREQHHGQHEEPDQIKWTQGVILHSKGMDTGSLSSKGSIGSNSNKPMVGCNNVLWSTNGRNKTCNTLFDNGRDGWHIG
ncbi:hypothetical protein PR003_g4609 [Phytophthora rubi]|uniref:Uncharacterized protein n=1 Tax=Phytophthora rubi TaxID=129364 RepID=A0A6A3NBW8_9STRA|nr:hypothetical protein PR002_g4627 [Phytophthora rubi]KAE9352020.1 hypothetical protein PR003_g4609 [Phytophthora rubi]